MIDIIGNRKVWEYLAIFAIGGYLLMQINGMSLLESISENYTAFYSSTLITGLIFTMGMIVFGVWYLSANPLGLSIREGLLITGAWTAFIFIITFSGYQIWPVPMAFGDPMQMTVIENYFASSVIPGFSEDLLYLAGFPMLLALFYLLPKTAFFGGVGSMEFLAVMVVACIIAATGYNVWVIPGFTSSHVPAYGQSNAAFAGAWIFSAGQSLVYGITGIFAPIPHILHNAVITYGHLYMVVGP